VDQVRSPAGLSAEDAVIGNADVSGVVVAELAHLFGHGVGVQQVLDADTDVDDGLGG
jgi:hypothetical protein